MAEQYILKNVHSDYLRFDADGNVKSVDIPIMYPGISSPVSMRLDVKDIEHMSNNGRLPGLENKRPSDAFTDKTYDVYLNEGDGKIEASKYNGDKIRFDKNELVRDYDAFIQRNGGKPYPMQQGFVDAYPIEHVRKVENEDFYRVYIPYTKDDAKLLSGDMRPPYIEISADRVTNNTLKPRTVNIDLGYWTTEERLWSQKGTNKPSSEISTERLVSRLRLARVSGSDLPYEIHDNKKESRVDVNDIGDWTKTADLMYHREGTLEIPLDYFDGIEHSAFSNHLIFRMPGKEGMLLRLHEDSVLDDVKLNNGYVDKSLLINKSAIRIYAEPTYKAIDFTNGITAEEVNVTLDDLKGWLKSIEYDEPKVETAAAQQEPPENDVIMRRVMAEHINFAQQPWAVVQIPNADTSRGFIVIEKTKIFPSYNAEGLPRAGFYDINLGKPDTIYDYLYDGEHTPVSAKEIAARYDAARESFIKTAGDKGVSDRANMPEADYDTPSM